MASGNKQVQLLARQFLSMSIVNGEVSPDRVAGVLQYIEKHRPPRALDVLKTYHRRRVISLPRRNDALLAGLRVRVGDDVYESSVASQLASLAAAV
jgi:F-type H+-transporting ATPase subunit delta